MSVYSSLERDKINSRFKNYRPARAVVLLESKRRTIMQNVVQYKCSPGCVLVLGHYYYIGRMNACYSFWCMCVTLNQFVKPD